MKLYRVFLLVLLPAVVLSGAGPVFNNEHLGISFSLPDTGWSRSTSFRLTPTTGWLVEYNNTTTFAFLAFSSYKNDLSNDSAIDTALSMLKGASSQCWVVRQLQFKVGTFPTAAREIRYSDKGVGYSALMVAFRKGEKQFLFFFGALDIKFGAVVADFSKILRSITVK